MARPSSPCAALLAITLLGFAPAARAAPRNTRVLLILDRAEDALAERVADEIAGIGFTVVPLEAWRRREDMAPLEAVARAERAVAAVRVLPSRKGVEVWMADETSGRSLLRQVIVDESASGPDQRLVALQTAELLRTSLLAPPPTSSAAAASPPPAPPPPAPSPGAGAPAPSSPVPTVAVTARAPGGEGRGGGIGVGVGFGPLVSTGGGGAAVQGWLSVRGWFSLASRPLGLAVDLSAPARGASVSGPEGTARLDTTLAGLAILLPIEGASSRAFVTLGVGGAVIHVGGTGRATPPLVGTSASATAAAGYLRGEGGVQATPWLRLGVLGVAGATTPRIVLTLAGNDAGTWGRPFATALAFAALDWR